MTPDLAEIDARIRASFARQSMMTTLGAEIAAVRAGEVEIVLPFSDRILQQHEFIHAGAVAAIGDTACGFAALTTMPREAAVLTTEFKINLLAPAKGERLRAIGRVVRAGKKLVITLGEVFAEEGERAQAGRAHHRHHDGGRYRHRPARLTMGAAGAGSPITPTFDSRGCGARRGHIPRGLTILTGAVPGRARGLGHMAPTYLCRFPGSYSDGLRGSALFCRCLI